MKLAQHKFADDDDDYLLTYDDDKKQTGLLVAVLHGPIRDN